MAGSVKVQPSELRELLRYNSETGKLFWRPRSVEMFGGVVQTSQASANSWNARWAGSEAFTAKSNGYMCGRVFRAFYRAHRVIWAIVHGEWPKGDIDHISGVRSDNRLVNLRVVPHKENCRNMARRADNKSGVTGVRWDAERSKWSAEIGGDHLGRFLNRSDAIAVRKTAEKKRGYHAGHGKVLS